MVENASWMSCEKAAVLGFELGRYMSPRLIMTSTTALTVEPIQTARAASCLP